MAKIKINKLTNANVYLDGVNLLGRASEISLPDINWKMTEHKGLGMIGTLEVPAGGLDKLEAKFKWASYYPEIIRKTANPRKSVQLQVRASLESYSGQGLDEETAVVVTLGGTFKKMGLGVFKQHEAVEPEAEMAVHFYKLVVAGETLLEIDVMNNIHKVAAEDLLARYRAIIGG